jgi:endonuclease/exonuclease/phosphatase family metal-dependent hydrolase
VRSCAELKELAALLPAGYTPYMVAGHDTFTGQNMGLVTRLDPLSLQRSNARMLHPVSGSTCGYSGPAALQGVAKNYVAIFQAAPGVTVALIGAHLLAHPTAHERCSQREAQAAVLRSSAAAAAAAGHHVIVLGDMNDYDASALDCARNAPASRALSILRIGPDAPVAAARVRSSSSGIALASTAVSWLKRLSATAAAATTVAVAAVAVATDTAAAAADAAAADAAAAAAAEPLVLHNACALVLQQQRFSDWYDRNSNCLIDAATELSLLDHVLVSSALLQSVTAVSIPHTYGPFVQPACVGSAAYVSDHWPVIVDFNVTRLVQVTAV